MSNKEKEKQMIFINELSIRLNQVSLSSNSMTAQFGKIDILTNLVGNCHLNKINILKNFPSESYSNS